MESELTWTVYLVKCSDNSLYCGITNDLKRRLRAHDLGKGAKYTRSRNPVELVEKSARMTKSDALKLENHIKSLPAKLKLSELKHWELYNEIKNRQTGQKKMRDALPIVETLQDVCDSLKTLATSVDKIARGHNFNS